MKHYVPLLLILGLCGSYKSTFSQSSSKPVFVIVHGAWGGSWAFKEVDSLLTEKGCIVYRPSLTGLGERAHLASTGIGLNTHIKDVVNVILYEDLHDIVLVGHSYGGMVITGVADSLPGRIRKLIYLDAHLPESGENLLSMAGSRAEWFKKNIFNGFLIPTWVPAGKMPPADVPHPFKTFTDTLVLKNQLRSKIPCTYILTVAKGTNPTDDDFSPQADRAKKKNWTVLQLESDHNPQWSEPKELTRILSELK